MSKQHQKSEDLCNNREELTGKKLPFPETELRIIQNVDLIHRPLSYHPVLRHLCNKGFTGLTCYEKKVRHVKILARCGMLRHASKPPPTAPRIWRCGMLRHAAAVGACCR